MRAAAAWKSAAWAWWKRLLAEKAPARVAAWRRKLRLSLDIIPSNLCHREQHAQQNSVRVQTGLQVQHEGRLPVRHHLPAPAVQYAVSNLSDRHAFVGEL